MTFILNEYQIENAQREAAYDFHRPNTQAAVLTLARLMEWTNENSDGWAYWKKPVSASTKLQKLVDERYAIHRHADVEEDVTPRELTAAYSPIKAFLTRQGVDHGVIFVNGQGV
jgi:putative salt-induced outer membrane protein YdiY